MKVKEKILIISLFLLAIVIVPIKSNAALQGNGNEGKKANVDNWMLDIRKMEATGGTLGLEDTINANNLTSSKEEKNNLDIHMQKNTEYGAMAILSASAYGNQNKINSGDTTTGNRTGIYINLNKEWVAAGAQDTNDDHFLIFKNANKKYKNTYRATYVNKIGDAIIETEGWHNSKSYWLSYQPEGGLLRACLGSIFSYMGYGPAGTADATPKNEWYSRAVIVIGNGF